MQPVLRVLVVTLSLLAPLAASSSAGASMELSAPVAGTIVEAGGQLPVAWSAACPTGMTCGVPYSDGSGVSAGRIAFAAQHASLTDAQYGIKGSFKDVYRFTPTGSENFTLDKYAAGGSWTLTASWSECANPASTATCTVVSAQRTYSVPLWLRTTSRSKLGTRYNTSTRKLQLDLQTECNAPGKVFRAKVQFLKRIKQGRKWRWVGAGNGASNVRASDYGGGSSCVWSIQSAFPRSASDTTQVRAKLVLTSTGVTPAIKPVEVLSKAFTKRALVKAATSSGSGGSAVVVVG